MSPTDNKSARSVSTLNSEQSISDQITEEERRMTEDDPYFMNLLRKDVWLYLFLEIIQITSLVPQWEED